MSAIYIVAMAVLGPAAILMAFAGWYRLKRVARRFKDDINGKDCDR